MVNDTKFVNKLQRKLTEVFGMQRDWLSAFNIDLIYMISPLID